jgi:hypothetical protein
MRAIHPDGITKNPTIEELTATLFNQKCNLLKARVIIYSYNHHVRLLPPERLVVNQSLLGSKESTLLCHQLPASKSVYQELSESALKSEG